MKTLFVFLGLMNFLVPARASDFAEQLYTEQIKPAYARLTDKTSTSVLGLGTVSVLGVRDHDNEVRDQWRDNQKMNQNQSTIGDHYISYGVNLGIAGLQYWLDAENGLAHIRALASTGLVTGVLKYSVHRERPNQANHFSFPSGHTSSAFATATSLTYAYGWKAAVPAYTMAVWTGLSRLADDDHWLSDVVAGGFIGFIFGRATYYGAIAPRADDTTQVWVPWVAQGRAGFQWSLIY